jgi:hypothetical protein
MMKYRVYGLLAVGFGAFLAARPLAAHHEILAKFDDKKPQTLKGTITKIDWANPHVHIFMNVQNGNAVSNWAVELESPVDLGRGGWTRDSVKIGDALTVQGLAARNGSRQVWANSVATTTNNKKLFDNASTPKPPANAPAVPHAEVARWTAEIGSGARTNRILGSADGHCARPNRRQCADGRIWTAEEHCGRR